MFIVGCIVGGGVVLAIMLYVLSGQHQHDVEQAFREQVLHMQAGKSLEWRQEMARRNPHAAKYLTHLDPNDPFWSE